jgi:hypothetical protein
LLALFLYKANANGMPLYSYNPADVMTVPRTPRLGIGKDGSNAPEPR